MKQNSSCETHFLGWDAPLLPNAARRLVADNAATDQIDLRQYVCVLPSARSIENLKQELTDESNRLGIELRYPAIATIGQLAELLYDPTLPLALELEQTLAWATVLQAVPPEELKPLIPVVPDHEPIGPWVDLGGTLRRLHEVLSANLLSFADVALATETEGEQRRWKLLAKIFDAYLSELAAAKICDPHVARRQAVLDGHCQTDKTVVLIGTSDLSDAMIDMLRSLKNKVVAMVAAPPAESGRFDDFGCVKTSGWLEHHLPVEDEQFVSAGDVADQAQAVAESICQWRSTYSTGQITVGVTDESHVGPVEVELRGGGIPSYRHLGWTLSETAVGRLMNLIATHLRQQSWQSLAALVRHGDVSAMVTRTLQVASADWLTDLDSLLADHFPVRLRDELPAEVREKFKVSIQVVEVIQAWLQGFAASEQTISAWSRAVDQCIEHVYEDRLAGPGRQRTAMAVGKARQVLERFGNLNAHLDISITSAAAMEMLTGRLSDVRFGEELQSEDVEIAGWLDLSLDTSPALIVVGLNQPFVPLAVTSDPFLPGTLRSKLKMADNDRRYARDVYAMHLMVTTRPATRFIVGRRSADGSPTPPSRLMAAAQPTDSARRVLELLESTRATTVIDHRWNDGPAVTDLPIPKLDAIEELRPVEAMSVTAFQMYLTCPYRFYLRYVLNLRPLSDDGTELAANQFGDLIHNTLDLFGRDIDRRDESNPDKIHSLLVDYLHEYARKQYGESATASVELQVAQAERRLKIVAQRQAERIDAGWRIKHVEKSAGPDQGSGMEVDGRWMTLKGRFDRIDYHPESGRWAILDYKTHGDLPAKKHYKKEKDGSITWLELQLPLYRRMAPFLEINSDPMDVELGYFNISQKDAETKINIADFGEALMRDADMKIESCIRNIWAGRFEPTQDVVTYDDYEMILQTGVAHQ